MFWTKLKHSALICTGDASSLHRSELPRHVHELSFLTRQLPKLSGGLGLHAGTSAAQLKRLQVWVLQCNGFAVMMWKLWTYYMKSIAKKLRRKLFLGFPIGSGFIAFSLGRGLSFGIRRGLFLSLFRAGWSTLTLWSLLGCCCCCLSIGFVDLDKNAVADGWDF